MKINLDTVKKTIGIEDNAKIGEFLSMIKKLLPGNLWKEYTILSTTEVKWYGYPQIYTTPYTPWCGTNITYCNNTATGDGGTSLNAVSGCSTDTIGLPQGQFQIEC